ncbi:type II secretion system protein GspD [Planctomycetaceae bacterium SH139]
MRFAQGGSATARQIPTQGIPEPIARPDGELLRGLQPQVAPQFPQPTSGAWPEGKTWTFRFSNAPWISVLREFSGRMGFSLTVKAQPPGEFTYLDDRAYSASEVIDILNDHLISLGFIVVLREGNLVVLSTAEPVNDQFVPFVTIDEIEFLGRNTLAGAAIPVSGMDVMSAMQEIESIKSPLGQIRPFSNSGRILVIETGSHLKRIRDLLMQTGFARKDQMSHVYQLHHASAEEVAKAINDFLENQANSGGGQVGFPSQSVAKVTPESTTNSLLLRGTAAQVNLMYDLICSLDRSPREVLLQALIVEVQLGNTEEFGVEMGFQDSVLFNRSIVDSIQTLTQTSTAPNGVQTTNQAILSQVQTPGFNFNTPSLGNNAISPGRIGAQSLSNFGMGRTNGDLGYGGLVLSAGSESVNVLLRALDANFNIDILSRPQIRTVENEEAFIQIGQQVPVVDGVSVNSVGSANPIVRQDRAGIILKATPRISPDGRVQVVVETEKSAFNLARGTGVPIFTDATTGRVIEAPVKDITTASTTVSIGSGQTIVLGGMITSASNVVTRKLPFLGDIPYLGRLFRYDLNSTEKKELLVFLTPIVLADDEHSYAMLNEELGHARTRRLSTPQLNRWEALRSGLLPGNEHSHEFPQAMPTDVPVVPPPLPMLDSAEGATFRQDVMSGPVAPQVETANQAEPTVKTAGIGAWFRTTVLRR